MKSTILIMISINLSTRPFKIRIIIIRRDKICIKQYHRNKIGAPNKIRHSNQIITTQREVASLKTSSHHIQLEARWYLTKEEACRIHGLRLSLIIIHMNLSRSSLHSGNNHCSRMRMQLVRE
jgi:hypothetical protein